MNIERKILILTVIIIFSLVLFNLWKSRNKMKTSFENFSLMNSESKEMSNMRNSDNGSGIVSIETTNEKILNMPLREFCVKSSFNTACSGTFMNTQAIQYVLSRGCRFIDFEVYLVNNILCVGVSSNPLTGSQNITSTNTITLDAALREIIVSGFSAPAPNPNDPLFVRIRLQSKNIDKRTSGIFKTTAMVIANTLINRLYTETVTSSTPLINIMGKIVLVWDKISSPDYKSETSLTSLISMESGGDSMINNSYNTTLSLSILPPRVHDDEMTSDVKIIRNISPDNNDSDASNPNNIKMIGEYGAQYVCNRFYIKDANLISYEEFFRHSRYAFVPFNIAIPYVTIPL